MVKIGIIGSSDVFESQKIKKLILQLRNTYGNTVEVVSGGNKQGIEKDVKKMALELELPYKEFNPAYTPMNGFSYMNESYYGKNKHPTHDIGRYRKLVDYCDGIVIFTGKESLLEGIVRYGEKRGKKIIKF